MAAIWLGVVVTGDINGGEIVMSLLDHRIDRMAKARRDAGLRQSGEAIIKL